MKKNFTGLFTILFVFSFSCIISAQSGYNLKYNFEKGKSYKYSSITDGTITQSMMGQEMKIGLESKIFLKMETEDVMGDQFSLLVSIDSGKVRTSMPMKDTTISLNENEGKRTRIIVEKNGKVTKKEIVDTVMAGMEEMGSFGNEITKLVVLPDKEIKPGETWNNTSVDSVVMMGGKILTTSNLDYTLAGKIDTLGYSCLVINFTGKTSSEGSAKIMGMDLFIEGNGKNSGKLYFAPAKGLIVFVDVILDNEMTMAATGEQNMIIPISQSMKSKQTILDK
ncbi:MAG: hypothetical protein C4539_02455 [Ignavibacteriales bacterium]|nr:MAG: hypothetical protein C4539_02455 [Ignavibacteriales bacterium]